jgi:hypothetical protein
VAVADWGDEHTCQELAGVAILLLFKNVKFIINHCLQFIYVSIIKNADHTNGHRRPLEK